MKRAFVAAVLLVLLGLLFAGSPHQGFSVECINEACRVDAATAPISLIASVALIAFGLIYRQCAGIPLPDAPVRVRRRLGAFLIDFMLVLAATVPLATLPVLLVEAGQTGAFAWSFERTVTRGSDMLATISVLASFFALFGYFYGHAKIGRPTIGQYLLGYKIVAAEDDPSGARIATNTFLAILGLCAWPISVWLAARRSDKAFWWNLRTGMRAIDVDYSGR